MKPSPNSTAALRKSVLAIGLLLAAGCANLNDPYNTGGYGGGYGGGPYGSPPPYYGGGGYYGGPGYNNYPNYNQQQEQRELERERRRLEEERRRLERERQQQNNNNYRPPPPPPPRPVERCPAGFSPSERKCSQDERRRGCRDIRLPGGLGCVAR